MNKDQFNALMTDNENILMRINFAAQGIQDYLTILLLFLSLGFFLVALKLDGIIEWSWLWVLAPGWLLSFGVMILGKITIEKQKKDFKRFSQERKGLIKNITSEN